MGIKEYTCHNEHRVKYGRAKSLHGTPETIITMYATGIKIKTLKNSINITKPEKKFGQIAH